MQPRNTAAFMSAEGVLQCTVVKKIRLLVVVEREQGKTGHYTFAYQLSWPTAAQKFCPEKKKQRFIATADTDSLRDASAHIRARASGSAQSLHRYGALRRESRSGSIRECFYIVAPS